MIAGSRSRQLHLPGAFLIAVGVAGCAGRPVALPTGAGTPYAAFGAAYDEATKQCRGVHTFAGLLQLSGRAGDTKFPSTRIEAGFAEPDRIRLEARAPFGRAIFILVGRQADQATLVLPRDKRVLNGPPAEAIIEALTGVALDADELRAIVAGCGAGSFEPVSGREYDKGWLAIEGAASTIWLRRLKSSWQVAAATRDRIQIRYDRFQAGRPTAIRITSAAMGRAGQADLRIRVSDVDINVALGPEVFQVEIPEDAAPLTLEELRKAGPLGSEGR